VREAGSRGEGVARPKGGKVGNWASGLVG